MICDHCAYEADQVKQGQSSHARFDEIAHQWYKFGAKRSPMGHAACTGCDCQHLPVGTAEGNPRA